MRYLKILAIYLRLGALNELEYRANFFIQVFQTLMSLLVSLGGLSVIFEHTQSLNGWQQYELMAVVGVYFVIGGWLRLIIEPSLGRFLEDVRTGTLDFKLLKPADAQILVSISQFQLWKLVDVTLGSLIIVMALAQAQDVVSATQLFNFVVAIVTGALIVYSFWMILASIVFWTGRASNVLVIFESMYEAGRYPVGIYPVWLRFTLTFLVPIAFAVTIPAEALINRLSTNGILGGVLLAAMLLVFSRAFWLYGLRNYTGASA